MKVRRERMGGREGEGNVRGREKRKVRGGGDTWQGRNGILKG